MSDANDLSPTGITDLPADILYNISSYLTAADFLSLTNCSRAFFQYRHDPEYWNSLTRRTFRLAPQPMLQANQGFGLYKKLRTQLKLYAWGNLKLKTVENADFGPTTSFLSIPQQPILADNVGIISDVQCGDHCIVILNSIGQLFILGSFGGRQSRAATSPRQLGFSPPSLSPTTKDKYNPRTAIQQYSIGRSSVLGLADNGELWSWTIAKRAVNICLFSAIDFINFLTLKIRTGRNYHVIHQKDIGLVYWPVDLYSTRMSMYGEMPFWVVVYPEIVPQTSYRRRTEQSHSDHHHDPSVGEVIHYIVLEDHVVFTTHLHKIYICCITPQAGESPIRTHLGESASYPTHLVDLTPFFASATTSPLEVQDLQGSDDRMALLTTASELLTADIHQLSTYITASERGLSPASRRRPHHFPAPQSGTITSLAFGQNHWHTLHSDGTVASLGQDPSGRGCLGLGGPAIAPFRGVQNNTGSPYMSGPAPRVWEDAKTVWFDALQHRWVSDLVNRSRSHKSSAGANARAMMIEDGHVEARGAMGDWLEREGRKWQDGIPATTTEDGSVDLGAYFAVKIAAGGLHSAALVLVDEEAAEMVRQKHVFRKDEHGKGKGIVGSAHKITHGMFSLGSRVLGLKGRNKISKRRYVWRERGDVLPRLKMESGQVMPGDEEVAN